MVREKRWSQLMPVLLLMLLRLKRMYLTPWLMMLYDYFEGVVT